MELAPIVVLLDGSPTSLRAVRWAAWLSQETDKPLEVVRSYPDALQGQGGTLQSVNESHERAQATQWLQLALDESPAIPSELQLVVCAGQAQEVLGSRLRPESVLVLGANIGAALLSWSARSTDCPVVIVPTTRESSTAHNPTAQRTRTPA